MIFYPLTIISIATGSYLVEIFDPKVCWFYWGAMLNHNVYSIAGGQLFVYICSIMGKVINIAYVLGWITAVYRLCVLKCGFIKDCIGVANLMRVLIASEFILFTICYGFYWLHIGKGFALSVKSPAMEFCTGTSQTFRGILGKQFDSKLWVSWQKIHFFDEFSLWSHLMLFIMESNIKLKRFYSNGS